MKSIKALLFLLMALMFGCQSSCVASTTLSNNTRYIDNQRNVSNFTNSVVALVRQNLLGGTRPYCSAFFVSPNVIATAAHCLEQPGETPFDSTPGQVGQDVLFSTYQQWRSTTSNHTVPFNHANIIAINEDDDVALLRTINFTSLNFLQIDSRNTPVVGSRVYALGLPGGLPWILSEGIVAGLEFDDSNILTNIVASAPIFFGSSGGPLVDNHGHVIGIVKAIAFRQSTFGIFTPIRKLMAIGTGIISDYSLRNTH